MIETQVDETKYGYVYRITNLINGKTYVGQHKVIKDEKWLTYMGSGRLVRYAIHKYGIENFSKELLGYAISKSDLDALEKQFIEKELVNGHSEYNINGSDAKLAIKLDELDLNDEDLLKWYFDENMSYNEIALRLNCSIPTIFNYMKSLKKLDKRFDSICEGNNRGKNTITQEQKDRMKSLALKKVVCENCLIEVSSANYSKHFQACSDKNSIYDNGFRKKECANSDCKILIYLRNTYCQKHYQQEGFQGISTPATVKRGGIVASHNRWHVKRGKVSENCELCQENLLK